MPMKDKYTTRLVIGEGSFVKIKLGEHTRILSLIEINDHGFLAEETCGNSGSLPCNHAQPLRVEIWITGRKGNLSIHATCQILKELGNLVAAKMHCSTRETLKLQQFFRGERIQLAA